MYVADRVFYFDICVIGGGSAGSAAAVYAARAGANVVLLEQQQAMGGMLTNGYVSGLAGIREGFAQEFEQGLAKKGISKPSILCPIFDPERAKLVLERMVHAAGVRIFYDVTVFDAVTEGAIIKEVHAFYRGTRIIVRAKQFIDCSGDAVVAAMVGVPVYHGNGEFFGYSSASTMHARVAHVNWEKWTAAVAEHKREQAAAGIPEENQQALMLKLAKEAVKNGDLPPIMGEYFSFGATRNIPGADLDELHDRSILWILHAYQCRNTDPEDMTRQIVEQHYQLELSEAFARKYAPGWENAVLSSIPGMNGVRDGRRIQGEYVFGREDMVTQRKFEDSIARFDDMFDLHHPVTPGVVMRHAHIARKPEGAPGFYEEEQCNLSMHPYGSPEGVACRTDPKGWCEIPYRSIVPLGIDNLFVAGRCFSADFEAIGGARLVATCMSTGQAAGIAAKLCIDQHTTNRNLNGREVHDYLRDVCGIPLDTVYGRLEERTQTPGEPYISAADSIKYRTPEHSSI